MLSLTAESGYIWGPSARWRSIVKHKQNNEKPSVHKQAIEYLSRIPSGQRLVMPFVLAVNSLVTFSADKKIGLALL